MTASQPRQPNPATSRRPSTVASRRSDIAAVTAAVRTFKTTHGRTPTFDETCTLMGWTPHHTRQVLATTTSTPPPPPSSPAGPALTSPAPHPDRPLPPEPATAPQPDAATQPGAIPLPPPDSPDAQARRRAWRWLVAHHQTPTEPAVTARARDATAAHTARQRRRARNLEQAATAATIAVAQGPQARQWIADYRATHHQGPLWRELADAMNWTPHGWQSRQHIMTTLAAHGYLTYHPDIPRSLNTGPTT